jgi:SAM-dependent methyltransferase
MSRRPLTACPGCGGGRLSAPYRIPRQPVILNYRFASAGEAQRVKRRDLRLVQCQRCGLVFNSNLDADAIPYDRRYENRQTASDAFVSHLEQLAERLIARHALAGKRILEVGCGKGEFLRMICERAGARGEGYDTSYEGPRTAGAVTFHKRYLRARDVAADHDLIICRHVTEHVGPIGAFLRELHAIARASGGPATLIETPSLEWIAAHRSFWDVFYEHCNYYTLPCLAYLCELAGFRVARQAPVFGAQYQLLELATDGPAKPPAPPKTPVRLKTLSRLLEKELGSLDRRLLQAGARKGWAVWGAGAKGVALVTRLRGLRPDFVIDLNPAKQGSFIAGSRVPIVAPDDPRLGALELIVVMNPNYLAEITEALRRRGFARSILTI